MRRRAVDDTPASTPYGMEAPHATLKREESELCIYKEILTYCHINI